MQSRRNPPGSAVATTLYFTNGEIDKLCADALRKSNFMPPSPQAIQIETYIESYFETTLDYSTSLGEGILGWTLFGSKGEIKMVGIDPILADDTSVIGNRRCRATAAHEAGHCLMHPILFMENGSQNLAENLDFSKKQILCRKDDFNNRYSGRWWEFQANRAIGSLLLPAHLLRQAVEGLLVESGRLGLVTLPDSNFSRAVETVSELFEVNKMPAEIRLRELFPREEENFL